MNSDKLSYSDLLKDPRWQKRKSEILNRDNFTCQLCGDKKTTLHVHHKYYLEGKLPWEYNDNALVTLCEYCHQRMHTTPNTDVAKIGDVFLYCHGDFEDYLMCYDIDYVSKTVCLAGMDNGSGSNSFWVLNKGYDDVYKYFSICDNFFNDKYWDDYRQQWLLSQYYYLLNDPIKLSIYDKDSSNVIYATKYNLGTIMENNKGFAYWYIKAVKDYRSIIII